MYVLPDTARKPGQCAFVDQFRGVVHDAVKRAMQKLHDRDEDAFHKARPVHVCFYCLKPWQEEIIEEIANEQQP